jgi:Zn-dependent protease with chaperone function
MMKNDTVQDRFAEAFDDLQEYGTLQWESVRLRAVEGIAVFLNAVAVRLLLGMIGAITLLFIGALITLLLVELTGSWLAAVGITGAVFILVGVIIIWWRRKIFLNSMVRLIAGMLFEKEKEE